jgi:hypothetical protein
MRIIRHVAVRERTGLGDKWSQLILVPLDDTPEKEFKPYLNPTHGPEYCIINERDFVNLLNLELHQRWCLRTTSTKSKRPQVCCNSKMLDIARLVMDCGPQQSVAPISGNWQDCRRSNLAVTYSPLAKYRDRDFIVPPKWTYLIAMHHHETDREFFL